MKAYSTPLAALLLTIAAPVSAGGMISEQCGDAHQNEVASSADVRENPDGYYVESLGVQLSHGDPRIVKGVGSEFHLCTTTAATPDMDAGRALLLMDERRVTYLFVPNECPKGAPSS